MSDSLKYLIASLFLFFASCQQETISFQCHNSIFLQVTPNKNWSEITLEVYEGEVKAFEKRMPKVMSASGIKFQQGELIFWSKGNRAFVTLGDSTIYDGCSSEVNEAYAE